MRCRPGIENVGGGLLAFALARIEQEAALALDDRQHLLARGRGPAAEDRRDLVLVDELARLLGVELGVGGRVHDDRLDRAAEQPAARALRLDQHDQQFLQRPLASRHGAGQRMQDSDLDGTAFEVGEVARHGVHQPFRAADQILGGAEHRMTRILDLRHRDADFRQHVGDGAGDAFGAVADAVDLDGLMIEDAGERAVGVAHGGDARGDRRYGGDRLFDRLLNVANLPADVAGGLGGLLRQRLHLAGHHREAAPGGAGARGLDGGVERQERGLRCDRLDQLHHRADALGGGGEATYGAVRARQVIDCLLGRRLGGCHLVAGARDQRQQIARRGADCLDVVGGVGCGIGRRGGARPHISRSGVEIARGLANFLAGLVEGGGHFVDRGAELLRDESLSGEVQLGFRLTAALRDRERVGFVQGLAHPLGRCRHLGRASLSDPPGQRGIAVAGGNLGDRLDERAQAPLGPPGRRQARRQCDQRRERQALAGPGGEGGYGGG